MEIKVRVDFLDFLRAVAILLVFLTHVRSMFDSSIMNMYGHLFSRGVQLFYLVSGFTIFMIYINKINTFSDFKVYILKRFFRIIPLFYVLLPIYYFTFGLGLNYESSLPDWYHLVSHYLLVFGFYQDTMNSIIGYAWSIFDEFLFYIVLGMLLIKFDVKSNIYKYIVALLFVSFFTFIINNLYLNDNIDLKRYFYFSPFMQMYIFFLGGSIFLISKKYILHKFFYFLSILLLLIYPFFIHSSTLSTYIASGLFGMIVLYLSQNKLTYPKYVLFFGKISFSFYLIHGFVIELFLKYNLFDLYAVIAVLGIFVLTTMLSVLSYNYIEQPFILYGRKLIQKRNIDAK